MKKMWIEDFCGYSCSNMVPRTTRTKCQIQSQTPQIARFARARFRITWNTDISASEWLTELYNLINRTVRRSMADTAWFQSPISTAKKVMGLWSSGDIAKWQKLLSSIIAETKHALCLSIINDSDTINMPVPHLLSLKQDRSQGDHALESVDFSIIFIIRNRHRNLRLSCLVSAIKTVFVMLR